MSKFAAPNCRADKSELKTKTGWSLRCADSVKDTRGNHPARAAVTSASARSVRARA